MPVPDQELKENVSEEEQTPSPSPEVEEDYVVISGKKRPLRNFTSEIVRKTKEDVLAEIRLPDEPAASPQVQSSVSQSDLIGRIIASAEDEMIKNGRSIPIESILGLISQGSQYVVSQELNVMKNAKRIIKQTKSKLREQFKDFREYESEFEDIVEDLDPKLVSEGGLRKLFSSIRGERIDGKMAKAEEKIEKEERIVGPVGGSGSGFQKKEKFTPRQKDEVESMGISEDRYLAILLRKQESAKSKGVKIPETLGEM